LSCASEASVSSCGKSATIIPHACVRIRQPKNGQPTLKWSPTIGEAQLNRAPSNPRADLCPTARTIVVVPNERLKPLTWRSLVLYHDRHEAIIRGDNPTVDHATDSDCP
jgi:hypothetical protein